MDGIILSQSEYLVFMDALHCSAVMGIDSQKLFPDNIVVHRDLINQGIAQLQKRGWMQIRDGRHIISLELLHLMNTIAHPELVIATLLDTPGVGQRIFLHYQFQERFAEQTFPTEEQYRVAHLPDLPTTLERILNILPIQNVPSSPTFHVRIERSLFLLLNESVKSATDMQISSLLQEKELSDENFEGAKRLFTALRKAKFTGTITMRRCSKSDCRIIDTVSVVQGEESAWKINGTSLKEFVEIQTIDAGALKNHLKTHIVHRQNPLRD